MKLSERISINTCSKIIRVCYGGQHGKQVYFSISKYGSYQTAIKAALDFEQSLSKAVRRGRHKAFTKANSNSTSGIVGVSPVKNRSGDQAGWRASWIDYSIFPEGIKKTKDFSYFTWGDNALQKACDYRDKMIKLSRKCLDKTL